MKLFKNRKFSRDGLINVFLAITSFLAICAIIAIGYIAIIAYIALLVYYPTMTITVTVSVPFFLLLGILACAAFNKIFPLKEEEDDKEDEY